MPVDIANFLARSSPRYNLAEIDHGITQNALGRLELAGAQRQNVVMANPASTPEDFARTGRSDVANALTNQAQTAEQTKTRAAEWLATRFTAIAQAPPGQAKRLAAMTIQSPDFQKGGALVGLPLDQFSVTEQDTEESLRASAAGIAQMLGAKGPQLGAGQTQFGVGGNIVASGPERDSVDYVDLGDRRQPVSHITGKPVSGLGDLQKGATPAAQAQVGTPEQVETTAQLIANGQIPMLTSYAMRTPFGQAVLARVGQLKPDFQANTYPTHAASLKDFTSGQSSRTVRSLNVAIAHLGTLDQVAQALSNKDVNLLNRARNAWRTQTGKPAPTDFKAVRSIVAGEIVKAVAANGGSLADRQEAQDEVNGANSPEQLASVSAKWRDLLRGQLGGLKRQYEQGTGYSDFNRFLSPDVMAQLEGEGGDPSSAPGASSIDLSTLRNMSDEELQRLAGGQ